MQTRFSTSGHIGSDHGIDTDLFPRSRRENVLRLVQRNLSNAPVTGAENYLQKTEEKPSTPTVTQLNNSHTHTHTHLAWCTAAKCLATPPPRQGRVE